jgi:predicted  nucleic acid-binding Zn-ribbon protein
MEKEANAYQLHFKGYRDRIRSLEREIHDRHTRLKALQNKVDQLQAEAKDRRMYMQGLADGVTKGKNNLVEALRQLLNDREMNSL